MKKIPNVTKTTSAKIRLNIMTYPIVIIKLTVGCVRPFNEGRRQEAGGRFCNEDLYPVTKTFRLKRRSRSVSQRGFKPDCFDNFVQRARIFHI